MNEITISLDQVEAYIKTLGGEYDEWWSPEYILYGSGLIAFLQKVDKGFGDGAAAILKLRAIEADRVEAERQDKYNNSAVLKQQAYLLSKFGEAPTKIEGQGYEY